MSGLAQTNVVETPAAHAPQRMRWSIVMLLMALCFISHMNRVSMPTAADERIMAQYGISPQQMGAVYSAFLLIYTLFMLPGGWLIDRSGPRVALGMMALLTALLERLASGCPPGGKHSLTGSSRERRCLELHAPLSPSAR